MGVKLLGKIKIHEIAKEVGLTSKEIIKIANDLGIGVTSHLSAVDDEQASQIKSKVGGEKKSENKEENKTAKKDNNVAKNNKKDTTSSNSKKQETPVIIRREVIISEEEKEEQNKAKQSEDNQKQVGFVFVAFVRAVQCSVELRSRLIRIVSATV